VTTNAQNRIDEPRLRELIVESEDLQVDALRAARESLPDLADIGAAQRAGKLETSEPDAFRAARRRLLRRSAGVAAVGAAGAMSGGFRSSLLGFLGSSAAAQQDENVDVAVLQTAGSIESLAIATYQAALGLPFIKDGNKVVKTFAETTMKQHDEHRAAFNAQAKALGGKEQMTPNTALAPMVEKAKQGLKAPLDVVKLAASLEEIATQTYLQNLTLLGGSELRLLMASVMGVESQHLATLRAVGALLEGGGEALIAIPTDAAKLPPAAGSVAFPAAFETTKTARDPQEGAVK